MELEFLMAERYNEYFATKEAHDRHVARLKMHRELTEKGMSSKEAYEETLKKIPKKNAHIASKFWSPDDEAEFDDEGNEIKAANGFHGLVEEPTHFLAGEAGPERVDITPRNNLNGMSDYFDIDLMKGFGETSYDLFTQKKTKKQTGDFDFMSGFGDYGMQSFDKKKSKKSDDFDFMKDFKSFL